MNERPTLFEFLCSVTTLGLATVDDAGAPYAANVNFVADERLDLYFLTNPQTAHGRHIAARGVVPGIAATVYAPFGGPAEIRGLQLRGVCRRVEPGEFERLWGLMVAKFPAISMMRSRAEADGFYRFTPTWAKWIDNSVRFGFKVEFEQWPPVE